MAPRMEKVSQIETGRSAGPVFSDIPALLSWHQEAQLAPMENSQVPSSSQIICTQKKKKEGRKKGKEREKETPFHPDSSCGVKAGLRPEHLCAQAPDSSPSVRRTASAWTRCCGRPGATPGPGRGLTRAAGLALEGAYGKGGGPPGRAKEEAPLPPPVPTVASRGGGRAWRSGGPRTWQ